MLNCITAGKKMPVEIISNLILAYSLTGNGAIIKAWFPFFVSKGEFHPGSCRECNTTDSCQTEIQAALILAAPWLAVPRSSPTARAQSSPGCPSMMTQSWMVVPSSLCWFLWGPLTYCTPAAPPHILGLAVRRTHTSDIARRLQSSNAVKGLSAWGHSRKLNWIN